MTRKNKLPTLTLLLLLIASSITIAEASNATVPKPSVPEFTVKFVEYSYDVPAVTTIDPYTGNNVTVQAGFRAEGKSIEIIIKNQPYSYTYNGSSAWLVYNVRAKGHFETDNWAVLYSFNEYTKNSLPSQSSSGFTNITLAGDNYPTGQVDFQVEALTEYQTQIIIYPHIGTKMGAYYDAGYAIGETSGWSNTQTITIGDNSRSENPDVSPSSSPSTPNPSDSTSLEPTTTPQQPGTQQGVLFGLDWKSVAILVLGVGVVVLLVVVGAVLRKRSVK